MTSTANDYPPISRDDPLEPHQPKGSRGDAGQLMEKSVARHGQLPAFVLIVPHYHPLIGPYDSGDPTVLEYHLLLMRVAGIDGVIIDWYGLSDQFDYPVLHRNTTALPAAAATYGLRFAICYEDQTIPKLVAAGNVAPECRAMHARGEISWLRRNWFTEKH